MPYIKKMLRQLSVQILHNENCSSFEGGSAHCIKRDLKMHNNKHRDAI